MTYGEPDDFAAGNRRPSGVATYATWTIKDIAIGFAVALVAIFLLSAALVFPFAEAYGDESPEALLAAAIVQSIWYGIIVFSVYRLARRKGGSWRELGLRTTSQAPPDAFAALQGTTSSPAAIPLSRILLTIISGYFASIAFVIAYGLLAQAAGIDALQPDAQLPTAYFDNDWLLPVLGLAIVGAAPIAEELLFRGFLYAWLRRLRGFFVAALISGFVFSLAHLDPGLIIPFTGVGIVLAYAYERTGSLTAPIGVHFVFNSVSFFLFVFVPGARE